MTKILEIITEVIGWVRIVLSPLLIGLVIGAIVYFNKQDSLGLFIAITVATSGLVIGIIVATRIWRKTGTISFLSRIDATPDIKDFNEQNRDS